jgi:hypothetical protein
MSSTPITDWTPEEIESWSSLPNSTLEKLLEDWSPEARNRLASAISKHYREKQVASSRGASPEKRKQQSNEANRRRAAAGSTVIIPDLSKADRKTREQLEADSEAWIWEMCGPDSGLREPLKRKFTSQQSEMIGDYNETLRNGGDEMLLASRGEGKTTYLRAMVWKSVVQGLVDFIGFIGATGSDAINSAEAIKDMMMRSVPFLRYYPEVAVPCIKAGPISQLANSMLATGSRFNDPSQTFEQWPIKFTWTADEISMPDVPGSPCAGSMMLFRGADSPIRGLNKFGKRPKVIAIDDLDTPDTTNNPDVAKKVIDRVNFDIGGLGTQTEPLARIMLATLPKSGIGVAHHFAAAGHPFVVKRFKYMIERPDREDLWVEYVAKRKKGKQAGDKYGRTAHAFYLAHRREMDAGAVVSNPHRFKPQELPDGTQLQVSAVQNYYDEWADKGEMYCRCELDNETISNDELIESKLEHGHVMNAECDRPRLMTETGTTMVVRGVDVRKTELHFSAMSMDDVKRNRVIDYDVRSHGTTETTVEQAEQLIYDGLCALADEWEAEAYADSDGGHHSADLTLIDKGWFGNWSEDGEMKTWADQPVERFCIDRGIRRYLPAKGQPNYRQPEASRQVIIGDNWHINRGKGLRRTCSEVIWSAEHWHSLVEGLFMLPDSDPDAFELFAAEPGVWINHKRLAEHIREGSQDLADLRKRATRSRKAKYRRDHWWDSFAMMLVARSVEEKLREIESKKKPVRTLAQMAAK